PALIVMTQPSVRSRPATANEIDQLLVKSRDMEERLRVWKASKETGQALKAGLAELRDLRNQVARHFGYSSFHALQVADYGMSVREMDEMLSSFLRDLGPLYRDLHCWTKGELARRYALPAPERYIPAHWIGNRWSQSWPGIVEAADLDPLFQGRSADWTVKTAESFYASLGFPKLPDSFWSRSDLYPVPAGSSRKKNTHASAWHMDLDADVRSLMSVKPDSRWFGTAHHELGHIYYYLSYAREGVPPLLRRGANRAFHEAVGELIGMASGQEPYLRQAGILPADRSVDKTQWLLNEALEESVAFLPWSAGTIASWERDLYELDLATSAWNKTWWSYAGKYQGVAPPEDRGEQSCDACTKTHVNDDPGQYYDYAIATVLKYQLHEHICRKILKQDPHACNYYGSRETGDFLKSLLREGAARDWRTLLREKTGSDLGTRAMAAYFQPLAPYLADRPLIKRSSALKTLDLLRHELLKS
ncbi:MAG: M2 family metallopeptidase, partial [Elusimicrobiota bacterium]